MSNLDWVILIGTLLFIVLYGTWKTKGAKNLQSYLKGNNDAKWWGIGISIMATQASAITFYPLLVKLIRTECVLFSFTLDYQ